MRTNKSKLLHDMVYAMVEYLGAIDVFEESNYEINEIGHWGIRYIEIDDECLIFESQGIHEYDENGEIEGGYRKFTWRDISDGDKESIFEFLTDLIKREVYGKK